MYVSLWAKHQNKQDNEQNPNASTPAKEELSIKDVFLQTPSGRIIILGEPGSGKSSLIRHAAELAWDNPDAIGLETPHVPVLVSLAQLANIAGTFEERIASVLQTVLPFKQKLSQDFFGSWCHLKAPVWLFLLDGLDEVSASKKAVFLQWLSPLLEKLSPHKFIITSRPSGYRTGDLPLEALLQYEIMPFSEEQASELSVKWLSERAPGFMHDFNRAYIARLQYTPLMLTIAAKVYLENGSLPERQSSLYTKIVDLLLEEYSHRVHPNIIDGRVTKMARKVLGIIALEFINSQQSISLSPYGRKIALYLERILSLSYEEAEVDARQLIESIGAQSGLLVRNGKSDFAFIHPTFYEFCAAETIVQTCNFDLERVWKQCISRWREKDWREVSLFALGLMFDEGIAMDLVFQRVLGSVTEEKVYKLVRNAEDEYDLLNELDSLAFVVDICSHNILPSASLRKQFANVFIRFIDGLAENTEIASLAESPVGPFEALRLLRTGGDKVRKLFHNPTLHVYLKSRAVDLLLDIDFSPFDIEHVIEWTRSPETVSCELEDYIERCIDIANILLNHNQQAGARAVLNHTIDPRYVYLPGWLDALTQFIDLMDIKELPAAAVECLLTLIRNPSTSQSEFATIAEFLVNLNTQDARNLLYSIAIDGQVDDWLRCEAAIVLTRTEDKIRAFVLLRKLSNRLNDSYARYYASSKLPPE